MTLTHTLDLRLGRVHAAPAEDGLFLAFGAIAYGHPEAAFDAVALMRYGTLWAQRVDAGGGCSGWQRISATAELRELRTLDEAESLRAISVWEPPSSVGGTELFFSPRGWRGKRIIRRAILRARMRAATRKG